MGKKKKSRKMKRNRRGKKEKSKKGEEEVEEEKEKRQKKRDGARNIGSSGPKSGKRSAMIHFREAKLVKKNREGKL